MSRSVARNIAANWLAMVVTGFTGLAVAPLVIRSLGPEEYGAWSIIIAITSQAMIFDFGIRNALVKLVAELTSKGDERELETTLSSALLMLLVISSAILVLSLLAAPFIPLVIKLPSSFTHLCTVAFIVAALDACIELVSGVAEAGMAGRERYDIVSAGSSVRALVNGGAVVAVTLLGGGIVGLAATILTTRAAYRLWMYVRLRRELPDLTISPMRASRSKIREILHYGMWAFAVVISTRIIFSIDVLVVGMIAGPVSAGIYSVCVLLVDQIRQLAQSGTTVLTPRLASLQGKDHEARGLIVSALRVVQALSVVVVYPLLFTGHGFLSLFAGPAYISGYPVMLLLILPFLVCLPGYLFTSLLFALSRHQVTARLLIFEAVLNLVLSISLGYLFGPIGVACGTFIPAVIFRGFLLPKAAIPICGISWAEYWREVLWRPLPVALVTAATLTLGTLYFGVTTISGWIATNTFAVFAFAAVAPALLMSKREQRAVLDRIHTLIE